MPSFLKTESSQRECECVAISNTLRRKRDASKVESPYSISFKQTALVQTGKSPSPSREGPSDAGSSNNDIEDITRDYYLRIHGRNKL